MVPQEEKVAKTIRQDTTISVVWNHGECNDAPDKTMYVCFIHLHSWLQ